MNWNLLISPGCLLLGFMIALYIKDSARGIAKVEFREQIGAALSIFKLDLIDTLDRRYRARNECVLLMTGLQDRINQRADSQDRQERKDSIRMDQQDEHMEYIDDREENRQ